MSPAIEFNPGEEMKIHCNFDTSSRDTVTEFGQATSDEMCLMIAQVYPYNPDIPVFCGRLDPNAGGVAVSASLVSMMVALMVALILRD